ncbi:MAG: hypothetical protein IPK79_01145 [Vampirovibrionales bacterium]|nr:hypothetical protein [Vampirovibrionales bacterium]
MSDALYGLGGLRFWGESEIELREAFMARCAAVVRRTLLGINPAWRMIRVEGPCLAPRSHVSAAYGDDDVFVTNHHAGGDHLCLRAETTDSSYSWARKMLNDGKAKMPLCVWQAGKSFRRETNDGASAAKLRFNEFWQLEMQCIYAIGTKADYRSPLISAVSAEISRFTGRPIRVVESERLPAYSTSTLDIEVDGREMASCSIRTDFSDGALVCEIAIGLDRVVTFAEAMQLQ